MSKKELKYKIDEFTNIARDTSWRIHLPVKILVEV